jgi:hypothetical protein
VVRRPRRRIRGGGCDRKQRLQRIHQVRPLPLGQPGDHADEARPACRPQRAGSLRSIPGETEPFDPPVLGVFRTPHQADSDQPVDGAACGSRGQSLLVRQLRGAQGSLRGVHDRHDLSGGFLKRCTHIAAVVSGLMVRMVLKPVPRVTPMPTPVLAMLKNIALAEALGLPPEMEPRGAGYSRRRRPLRRADGVSSGRGSTARSSSP